jgi:hypothetical protein
MRRQTRHVQLDQAICAFDFDKALTLLPLFDFNDTHETTEDTLSIRRLFRAAVTHDQFKVLDEMHALNKKNGNRYGSNILFLPQGRGRFSDATDMITAFTLVVLDGRLEMLKTMVNLFYYHITLLDSEFDMTHYAKTKESMDCFKYLVCRAIPDDISCYENQRTPILYSSFLDDPWWRSHCLILKKIGLVQQAHSFELYLQQVEFQRMTIKMVLEDKLLKDILVHIVCPYL